MATGDDLEDLMATDQLVLAVFWEPSCAKSQEVIAWAEACVAQTEGAVQLSRVEYQADSLIARQFTVSEAPSVLLLYNGQVLDRLDGNFEAFCHWLTESINLRALARV